VIGLRLGAKTSKSGIYVMKKAPKEELLAAIRDVFCTLGTLSASPHAIMSGWPLMKTIIP
jgi:hypothetical protein